ncbi:unnamed protein product, partial [Polarella glacialis]
MDALQGKRLAMVGPCWGGWAVFRASAVFDGIRCGVVPHPSCHVEDMLGGSLEEITAAVRCPILFMPAASDLDTYKPGGSSVEVIKARFPSTASEVFKDMSHGWLLHGSADDLQIRQDLKRAVDLMTQYLEQHLQEPQEQQQPAAAAAAAAATAATAAAQPAVARQHPLPSQPEEESSPDEEIDRVPATAFPSGVAVSLVEVVQPSALGSSEAEETTPTVTNHFGDAPGAVDVGELLDRDARTPAPRVPEFEFWLHQLFSGRCG